MSDNKLNLPNTGFVRISSILHFIPVGKSTWWEGVKTGRYPAPVKLSPRVTAWRVEDIKKLIADHSKESEASNV